MQFTLHIFILCIDQKSWYFGDYTLNELIT